MRSVLSMRPNYFVGLDVHNPSELLMSEITKVQTTIKERNAKLRSVDFTSSYKLHITLGLLRVRDEGYLPRISSILYEVAAEMKESFKSPCSTRLVFDSLHYFPLDNEKSKNRQKKRVVYLKPTEESVQVLRLYSSRILEATQSEGAGGAFHYQPTDLHHLTLCKTRNMLIHKRDLDGLAIENPLGADCRFIRLYKIGSSNGSGGYLSYGGVHFTEHDITATSCPKSNDDGDSVDALGTVQNGDVGVYEEKYGKGHNEDNNVNIDVENNKSRIDGDIGIFLSPKRLLD